MIRSNEEEESVSGGFRRQLWNVEISLASLQIRFDAKATSDEAMPARWAQLTKCKKCAARPVPLSVKCAAYSLSELGKIRNASVDRRIDLSAINPTQSRVRHCHW